MQKLVLEPTLAHFQKQTKGKTKGAVMAPIKDSLAELAKVAAELNEETDSFNSFVEGLEKELASHHVGVSVWLDYKLDAVTTEDEPIDGGPHRDEVLKIVDGWELGYCKIGDAWRIAAKRVRGRETTEWEENGYGGADRVWEWADVSNPTPLIQAPRIVRIEAADHLDSLVKALSQRVKAFAESIKKAKTTAKK